jgi:hypothetical protein
MNRFKKLVSLAALLACAPYASAAGFAQGTIEGMPDVLVLNRISAMELAKAPDSLMYRIGAKYLWDDQTFWQDRYKTERSAISVDRESHVSLKPLLMSAPITQTPDWAKCPPDFVRVQSTEKDAAEGANVLMGYYRQKMVSSCGQDPAAEAKTNEFIDKATGLVRAVQADTRKATQFAILVKLNFEYERDMMFLNQHDTGAPVKVADLDQSISSTGIQMTTVQRTAAGVAVRIGWGHYLSSSAQLGYCMETYDVENAASQYMLRPGDVSQICFAMRGMKGMTIPISLMVRDITQFKQGDDLRLAVVFAPEDQSVKSPRKNGTSQRTVTVRPAYAQVVDIRTKRVIGERIAFDRPGAFVYLRPSECFRRVTREWPNAQASAERGCSSDELRAMATARGKASLLQTSADELKDMEKQLLAMTWGDK